MSPGLQLSGLLLLLASLAEGGIRITASTPESGSLVREGEAAVLSCTTDRPWFLCQWLSPGGTKSCALRDSGAGAGGYQCQGEATLPVQGDDTSCSVTIGRVGAGDRGGWTCVLQDGQDLTTDRRSVVLQVARQAKILLGVEGGQEGGEQVGPLGWGRGARMEGNILSMMEGEQVEVKCSVMGANPRPLVEWRGPEGSRPRPLPGAAAYQQQQEPFGARREEGGQGGSSQEGGQGGWPQDVSLGPGREEGGRFSEEEQTYSTVSVLSYTARAWHNNRSLTCEATQTAADGSLVYRTPSVLFLQVQPLPPSPYISTGPSQDEVGMIVGIVIGCLAFIILVIVTVIFLIRFRRRRKDSEDSGPTTATTAAQPPSYSAAATTATEKTARPPVWLRLTSLLRRPSPASGSSAAPSGRSKPPGSRPSQGRPRTLSPIPGSVQSSSSRPGSRTSQLNSRAPSLASLGSRTSVNTQQSAVNMAPERGGGASPVYSMDETEML